MAFDPDPEQMKRRIYKLEEAMRELLKAIQLASDEQPVTTSNWAYQRANDLVGEK